MPRKSISIILFLMVILLSWNRATISNAALLPATPTAAANPLTGTWEFSFGTMTLTQKGARVTGTYQWYGGGNSGKIRGIFLSGLNQFSGLWVSDGGGLQSQGLFRLQLAPDGNSFNGVFERASTRLPWCGVRAGSALPAGCGFSGEWQMRFGSPAGVGQATLIQAGPILTGTFTNSAGQTGQIVEGLIVTHSQTEARATGTWREGQGQPESFDWRLNLTTGTTFQGRRDPGKSDWCGWREGVTEAQPCGW